RSQPETQRIERGGRRPEERRRQSHEAPGEAARKNSGGQLAHFGARIAPVDGRIHQPVERHRGGTRPDHRHRDPGQLPADFGRHVAAVAKSQQRPGEGERQGENRMLELDHVEREAQAFPKHVGGQPSHFTVKRARATVTYGRTRAQCWKPSRCLIWDASEPIMRITASSTPSAGSTYSPTAWVAPRRASMPRAWPWKRWLRTSVCPHN